MNEAKPAAAELIESGAHSQSWRTSRGTMTLRWSDSGALLVVVGVHGDRAFAPLMTERADSLFVRDKMKIFFDFWHMPNYDSELRTEWTRWLLSQRPRLDGIQIVARSKIVAMGVLVANVALGGIIQSHPTRNATFLGQLKIAGLKLPDP